MRGATLRRALPLLVVTVITIACAPAITDPNAPNQRPTGQPAASATSASTPTTPTAQASPTVTRTPRPSITLNDRGLPNTAIGPLLLVRTEIADNISFGPGSPSPEVAILDVGAGHEIGRVWIGDPSRQPRDSVIAGHHLLVNFGDVLWRYTLDGDREQLLAAPPGSLIGSIAVEPTGAVVVAALQTGLTEPPRLVWIEVATGDLLREHALTGQETAGDPLPRIVGRPTDATLLRGTTRSDPNGSYAVLEGSGTTRGLATTGPAFPSPDGQFVAHGPTTQGCDFLSGPRIELLATGGDATTVAFEDRTMALTPWEWAPDGSEFAFQARQISQVSESCDWTADQPRWLVLATDGTVREASSAIALRASWYEEQNVSFICGNVPDTGARDPRDGLLRPGGCARSGAAIQVTGITLAQLQNARILGFIEVN